MSCTINSKQSGFSLIEIMIGMIIGIFLIGGVFNVYMANRASYRFAQSNSEIQNKSRFIFDLMSSDLRMSRFLGCLPYEGDTSNVVNHLNVNSGNYELALHDFTNTDSISFSEGTGSNGSDSILIKTAYPTLSTIQEPYNISKNDPTHISKNKSIKINDIALISNCSGGDIFEINNILDQGSSLVLSRDTSASASTPGNVNNTLCSVASPAHCLSQTYGSDAVLFILRAIEYSVKANNEGGTSLFRRVNKIEEELLSGVDQLQLLYGVDTNDDGGPNQYVVSDAIPITSKIVSVRILLLLSADTKKTLSTPQTITFNGATSTSGDLKLRRSFSLTVGLRNK